MKIIELLFILLVIGLSIPFTSGTTLLELNNFLVNDTTNNHKHINNQFPFYTCGHFTYDLIENASSKEIEMHPTFLYSRKGTNHIVATIEINGTWLFIEPQNDEVFLEYHLQKRFRGYKIGTSVTHSPFLYLNRVNGFIELKTWN